jgi:carboxyl-terminal processing protease
MIVWLGLPMTAVPAQDAIGDQSSVARPDADPGELSPVFRSIYQGNFIGAGQRLVQAGADGELSTTQRALREVVDQYASIEARREEGRKDAYEEEMRGLKELQATWTEILRDPAVAAQYPLDPNDPNAIDPNDMTPVLAAVANVLEYATSEQKVALLDDPFVNQVLERCAGKSAELEAQGEWLEAYSVCYAWLKAIDPNNEAYSDYAEELIEKATIAASFEDSPCETSEQRYEGVRKRTFVTAVHILSVHYVNGIDFSEMALSALRRCRLLGEVVKILPWEKIQAQARTTRDAPKPNAISAWTVALAAMEDEIERASTDLDDRGLLDVFENVLRANLSTAELPEEILVTQFAEAALGSLDPHTNIIWPRQVSDFDKAMTNEFTGIGIEITKTSGKLTVASLLLDTPAYQAGLDAGDVIAEVDGVSTKDMSLHCAVKKITGPKGTEVKLKVIREGVKEPLAITLERDRITVPTIRGWQRIEGGNWRYMIDDEKKIGYVRVTSFSAETAQDLENVLTDLEKKGLKGLILDLRWNSGGLLNSAVNIVDKFISSGLVVWTQPGYGRMPDYQLAHTEGTHPDYPLVVLVNAVSASASEIVAGALADPKYERAVLVGERTHGKGSVQVITDYRLGGAHLKYTMAYYHLPSGQRVKSRDVVEKEGGTDWGVGPDIEVKLRSDEIRQMLKVQKANDVLVQKGHDQEDQEATKHTVATTLEADPQLAVGLLVVRAKLAEQKHLAMNTK